MRLAILVLVLLLVFVSLNYILKCLEYKDLRDLFDNRGNSIKMLNDELVEVQTQLNTSYKIRRELIDSVIERSRRLCQQYDEIASLKRKVYVLKKDVKRKDRAIVRYKAQNEAFRHCYHAVEARNTKLENKVRLEENVSEYYKGWYKAMQTERDAYLYCLRQIQEEVEHAKKE